MDASSGPNLNISSVEAGANSTANAIEIVRTCQKKKKPSNLPSGGMRWAPEERNGCGHHMNGANRCTGARSVRNETETAGNGAKSDRM